MFAMVRCGKIGVFLCGVVLVGSLTTASADAARISTPVVYQSIRSEFGNSHGSYLVPNGLVSEQIIMALGIPQPLIKLADGDYLLSGCRPHSCDEKAAVIVTSRGQVLAAGLINFRCHLNSSKPYIGTTVCDRNAHLTLFLRKKVGRSALDLELRNWASRQTHVQTVESLTLPPI